MWTVEHGMVVRRYGDGPEVIWIHGLGEMSASFDAIVRHPLLAGFTHVLPDLPGYGRSRWPNVVGDGDSLDALADQLATWQTGQRPILVGHSMGGVLATLVAERIAVSGIVDIDGNLSRGDCTFSAEGAAYDLPTFLAHGWAAMRDAVYARGVGERALRGYHAGMVLASPAVFHRNATDLVALSSTEALAPRLAAVAGGKLRTTTGPVPVLFVAGAPGGVCARSRELLAAHAVPTVALEPSGHWPYIDQPDAFAAAIAPVLREAAASRGA